MKVDDICEELVNEPEEEEESESSKFLSMSMSASERHDKGLKLKAKRDEMVDLLSKDEDIDEKHFQLAHFIMAELTVKMAGFGVLEEEEHSSLAYCEEHADKLYQEGGWEKFKERMDYATAVGKMHNLMSDVEVEAKLEKLKQDGDNEGYLRLVKEKVQEVDGALDSALASQGLPPKDREDIFIGTLIDDELFRPPPVRPDCAVCMITLPARNHTSYMPCCGKVSLCVNRVYSVIVYKAISHFILILYTQSSLYVMGVSWPTGIQPKLSFVPSAERLLLQPTKHALDRQRNV